MVVRGEAVLVSFIKASWFCSLWINKPQAFCTYDRKTLQNILTWILVSPLFNTRFIRVGSALLPGSQFHESAGTLNEYYKRQQHKTVVILENFIRLVSRHGFLFVVSSYSFLASSFTTTEHIGMVSWPRSSKILPIRHSLKWRYILLA